jgi:four helix bundle protein
VEGWVLGKQLIRSATSVAANYRATNVARSRAEFFAKLCIVVEESDETVFWLELTRDAEILTKDHIEELNATISEASQLLRIFSSARKSTKINMTK